MSKFDTPFKYSLQYILETKYPARNLEKINHLPIHKQGLKNLVSNYRPIAQISPIAKLLDNIVTLRLNDLILPSIVKNQHGFVPGKSVITNLLFFNDYIANSLSNKLQVDVAFMDFNEAFDSFSIT